MVRSYAHVAPATRVLALRRQVPTWPRRAPVCVRAGVAHAQAWQGRSRRRPCDAHGQPGPRIVVRGAGAPGTGAAAAGPGPAALRARRRARARGACSAQAHAGASDPRHPDAVRTAGGRGRHGAVRPGTGAAARRPPALPRAARAAGRARVRLPHGRAARQGSAAACRTTSTGRGGRTATRLPPHVSSTPVVALGATWHNRGGPQARGRQSAPQLLCRDLRGYVA